MQQEKEHFLNLKISPARLTAEEAAWFLGFSTHEIPILMAEGLLKPLGRPPSNGPKYFGTAVLEELRRDQKWLARASDAIVEYWKTRNDRRGDGRQSSRRSNRTESKAVEQMQ
jgi:hypothetical protein